LPQAGQRLRRPEAISRRILASLSLSMIRLILSITAAVELRIWAGRENSNLVPSLK